MQASAIVEIDNRGRRLTGCMTCNIWWSADDKKIRLSKRIYGRFTLCGVRDEKGEARWMDLHRTSPRFRYGGTCHQGTIARSRQPQDNPLDENFRPQKLDKFLFCSTLSRWLWGVLTIFHIPSSFGTTRTRTSRS